MILQIIVCVFVLWMIVRLAIEMKNNQISLNKFLLWTLIWIGLAIIALIPGIVNYLASLVGIERARDLPIYVSVIILFIMVLRIGIKIEKIEQEITNLVKSIALKRNK